MPDSKLVKRSDRSEARCCALTLIFACALFFIPGLLSLPPVDRDEPRFAQATRQMVERGDFFTIETFDQPRNKKPPGIYWLQAIPVATAHLMGVSRSAIWPYRIVSFLGAALSVILTFHLGRRLFNTQVGYVAALMLAASTLLIIEAHLATTDAVLLAIIVGCFHQLLTIDDTARGHDASRLAPYAPLFLWLLVGLGIFIKGPIAPLVVLLTIGGLRVGRHGSPYFRWPRVVAGLGLSVVISLPWLTLINDGQFFREALLGDLLPKVFSGQESHGFWPLFYVVILPATFFPGSLFLIASWKSAWCHRADRAVSFCLACFVPTWIVFELIPTKLPHYVLPTSPAIALLIAAAIWHGSQGREDWRFNIGWLPGITIWCALAIGFGAALTLLSVNIGGAFDPLIAIPIFGAFAMCVLGVRALLSGFTLRSVEPLIWSSAFLMPVALSIILPRIDALWPSRSVARLIQEDTEVVGINRDMEPSLYFLLGNKAVLTSRIGTSGPHSITVTSEYMPPDAPSIPPLLIIDDEPDSEERFSHLGIGMVTMLGEVRGFNISKGEWITLYVYELPYSDEPRSTGNEP